MLYERIHDVVDGRRLLVGVDFDGTLSEIVAHPADAEPIPGVRSVLERLASVPEISLVVVSGRARDDLIDRIGPIEGAVFIGEHGNDDGSGGAHLSGVEDALDFVGRLATAHEGAVVESKRSSVTFHTRNIDRAGSQAAEEEIRRWSRAHPQYDLMVGKEVFELSIASKSKGDAVRERAAGATTIFFGDDTTDESVFEIMSGEDIGVKVGPGDTAAGFRLGGPSEVKEALEEIVRAATG